MRIVYFISVFLHIVSATVWVGGMLFLALVIVPIIRKPEFKPSAGLLLRVMGLNFRFWSWVCLVAFFITGVYNLSYRFNSWTALIDANTWQGIFGQTLAIKLILFGFILSLSAWHDFYIGPRAVQLLQEQPDSAAAMQIRRQASWLGRVNLLLGLIMVMLGTFLVRGLPWS